MDDVTAIPGRRRLQQTVNNDNNNNSSTGTVDGTHPELPPPSPDYDGPMRILYTVTTLAEYNNGFRKTVRGSDRLQDTTIPVMRESVESMLASGYVVDVQLIAGFVLKPERAQLIRDALPEGVRLFIWDDATPLAYKLDERNPQRKGRIQLQTRALARQHRFVIKDRFFHYDFFVNFEDDMLIKGVHVEHYMNVTNELFRLRKTAPNTTALMERPRFRVEQHFYGELTNLQLMRMMPGFMRVESLLDEDTFPAQNWTGPMPVDLDYGNGRNETVNPSYCCQVSNKTATASRPMYSLASKLFIWECNILALGVRKMPEDSSLGWVLMQRGPTNVPKEVNVGDFHSGRVPNVVFEWARPPGFHPKHVNNQGGWMATRQQIWELDTVLCLGGFLPPFSGGHYNMDGLDLRNVEYWSGGLQIATRLHGCNMQRIISLDPDDFSKSLIYHTANNKQRQRHSQREDRFSKVNTLLGQLNKVKKTAEAEMMQTLKVNPS